MAKGLSAKEQRALLRLKELLLERFGKGVLAMKLYGSKARGEANKFSDVDVLVVIRKGDWKFRRQVRAVGYDVFEETGVDISIVVMEKSRYDRLRRWHFPFIINVQRDGIAI